MKWKNKGHEYDLVYKRIEEIKGFYLFGAGDYGNQFFKMIDKELSLIAYVDNSKEKQGSELNGLSIQAFPKDRIEKNQAFILTVSQIQRMKMVDQLENAGYKRNEDYFLIEEFISVYYVYKYNKVYFSTISMLPSTRCNLNCELCLNFNPYAKTPSVRSIEQVKADIDAFFGAIDYIMLFHISGGEPMLYKDLPEVISYLDKKYGDRIGTIRTVTNGTVVPSEKTLEKLKGLNFEITVDDYREAVPKFRENFDKLLAKLDEYGIRYWTNYTDEWIDLAPMKTDYSSWTEERLQKHFDDCCQSWQELRDGKIFMCNYSAYAAVAGINKTEADEYYNLRNYDETKAKELIEFRLGYSEKGYVSFCKKCRGFSSKNQLVVKAAKQVGE